MLHKVVDFAIFLGSLRISIFTLLEEIEDERVYPEIYNDFAKSLYTIEKSISSRKFLSVSCLSVFRYILSGLAINKSISAISHVLININVNIGYYLNL